ncbi:hypothetical protein CYMTET_49932 [Cymbomonas tetramitiformis]|uniref:Uncharacterized protein n=1 Tax=Cymbomonas tetramitiformis TaxID=36881 RepID=A0AAE0BQF7_9CHLO|nr:hypothetical protein CYMTET_49932 [Cymbomonas tetramitiformis]
MRKKYTSRLHEHQHSERATGGCAVFALSKLTCRPLKDTRRALNESISPCYRRAKQQLEIDPNAYGKLRGVEDGRLAPLRRCHFGQEQEETYSECVVASALSKLDHERIAITDPCEVIRLIESSKSKVLIYGAMNPDWQGCREIKYGFDIRDEEHVVAVVNGRLWCQNLTRRKTGRPFSLSMREHMKINPITQKTATGMYLSKWYKCFRIIPRQKKSERAERSTRTEASSTTNLERIRRTASVSEESVHVVARDDGSPAKSTLVEAIR